MLVVSYGVNYLHLWLAAIAWLTIVFRGYLPEQVNTAMTFANSFYARLYGYIAILTDDYPPIGEERAKGSTIAAAPPAPPPAAGPGRARGLRSSDERRSQQGRGLRRRQPRRPRRGPGLPQDPQGRWESPRSASTRSSCPPPTPPAATTTTSRRSSTSSTAARSSSSSATARPSASAPAASPGSTPPPRARSATSATPRTRSTWSSAARTATSGATANWPRARATAEVAGSGPGSSERGPGTPLLEAVAQLGRAPGVRDARL